MKVAKVHNLGGLGTDGGGGRFDAFPKPERMVSDAVGIRSLLAVR